MYEGLIARLRYRAEFAKDSNIIYYEAADAIESMSEMVATAYTENANIIQSYEDSKPRWIPVTERLPEEYESVLCWYEYYHWSKEKILPEYGTGYIVNGRWGGEVSNGRDCKVLAWMPLPEPPKED